jgi:hypothetical protein
MRALKWLGPIPAALLLCVAGAPAFAQGSGKFERAQPAAPPAPAVTPPPGDPVVRELMRKAAGKEAEAGFCARLPDKDGGQDFNHFDKRPAGSTMQYSRHNAFLGKVTCGLYRIGGVFTANGKRCIQLDHWNCYAGETCIYVRRARCENASGSYDDFKPAKPR